MRVLTVTGYHPLEKMGGAEYQTSLIAHGLAARGHEVIFLATSSHKDSDFIDGNVYVKKISGREVSGLHHHRRLVAQTIQEISPDICYVRVFEELGTIVPVCRANNIPVVSMSCHAMETTPFLIGYHPIETLAHLRGWDTLLHLLAFLSIRVSNVHVCNTGHLQKNINRWYPHIPIKMIYNGSPVPPEEYIHHSSSGQVVWINNLKRWKRPEVFIELARRLPTIHFVMVGRIECGRSYTKMISAALRDAPANLQYLGPLAIDQVNNLISQSDLLLYTSLPIEGFGNSFLQAWLRGVPTVSLSFDLDGILGRYNVGRCSKTFEQLVIDVQELMSDEMTRQGMGRRAREYALHHHSEDGMVSSYEALFNEVNNGR